MVSSYRPRRRVSSNSDNISTNLKCLYLKGEFYTTRFFGRNLAVTVTSNPRLVRSWISKSLFLHRHRFRSHHKHKIILGLGTQWRPFQSSQCPATIQICIGHRILIFQILGSRSRHTALSRLLRDCRITFVGYNIGYDCHLHKSYHGLEVTSTAELRSVSGMGTASMERMTEKFLGYPGVEKPKRIGTSDWDARMLSVDQIQYAALDAHLSFLLGVELVANPASTMTANRNRDFECNMIFGIGGADYGLYSDNNLEDSDKYESDSSSGDSGSKEYGW